MFVKGFPVLSSRFVPIPIILWVGIQSDLIITRTKLYFMFQMTKKYDPHFQNYHELIRTNKKIVLQVCLFT